MPGEKTEKASFKKREDERKKGHAFLSKDLVGAFVLLGVFGTLNALGGTLEGYLTRGMANLLNQMDNSITGLGDIRKVLAQGAVILIEVLLPIFAAAILSAVAVTFAQTRFLVTPSQIAPKFGRISPIQGFKRLFSLKSLVEMIKSLLKITLIIAIIAIDIYPHITEAMRLFDISLASALSWTAKMTIDVGLKSGAVLLVLGVGDYFFQWWSFEREIMMTKYEVKEEFKQTEGNPQIKGRIRNLQRRMARLRMMQAVPQADVVIRNPTHFAVALKYDQNKGKAPFVVAKGRDAIALKIVEVAEKNRVYITENKPLAQALYKTVEIGEEIPQEFFRAVAEILAYLYRLKKAGRR